MRNVCILSAVLLAVPSVWAESDPPHPVMTWVKRHPLPDVA